MRIQASLLQYRLDSRIGELPQGLNRAAPDRPEWILLGPGSQRLEDPGIIFESQEIRRGRHPPDYVVVAQLVEKFIQFFWEIGFLQQHIPLVEADEPWPRFRGEFESLLLLTDSNSLGGLPSWRGNGNGDGNSENRDTTVEILDLRDPDRGDFPGVVPLAPDIEDGMSRLV
jgi:hypothetical protein